VGKIPGRGIPKATALVFSTPTRRPAADSSSHPFGSCSRPHLALLTEREGERETEQTRPRLAQVLRQLQLQLRHCSDPI